MLNQSLNLRLNQNWCVQCRAEVRLRRSLAPAAGSPRLPASEHFLETLWVKFGHHAFKVAP